MKRTILITLFLAIAIASSGAAPAVKAQGSDASVYVIHGIPGQDLGLDAALPVDVLVNDSICALQGFTFGEIAGPLSLAAGTYNIKISVANPDSPCSNDAVIAADVPFSEGENASVIAHLTEAGAPTASKYTNNVSDTRSRMSRLAIRHTAAAPEVDVEIAADIRGFHFSGLIEGLSNPEQVGPYRLFTWPKYRVTIYPAGQDEPVFGPVSLKLKSRTANFVYAVGSLTNSSFTFLTHTIPLH